MVFMNIVIIDDSRANLAFMSDFIRAVGATPLTYADPVRALADAPNLDADLFLVDYNMPQMDGLEVISALRKMAWSADIPIIMITAYGDADTKRKALEGGAEALLTKPIDFVLLRNEIETRVGRAA